MKHEFATCNPLVHVSLANFDQTINLLNRFPTPKVAQKNKHYYPKINQS